MYAGKLRQLTGKEFQLLKAEYFSGSFASGNKMPPPSQEVRYRTVKVRVVVI